MIKACEIDLGSTENLELVRHIFAAKQVALPLLRGFADELEFHRRDWPAVVSSTEGELQSFDFYFAFVLEQVRLLEPLWME